MNEENKEYDALFRLIDRINQMKEAIKQLTEENQQLRYEASQNKEIISQYRNAFQEMKDFPPEFHKVLEENFWELLC